MPVRIGLNGFGRIGRYLTRLLARETGLELAMINARADNATLAHLLKYDSIHGTYAGEIVPTEAGLAIDGHEVAVSRQDIGQWTWGAGGVDIVVETSGRVKDRAGLARHLDCGAKKAVIAAPAGDADLTVVMGVNDHLYDPARHQVLSNASCTTNCLAPAAKTVHEAFGIRHGHMTTVHAYTMNQRILDGSHKDLRRARAAALSIIPTTTGAARAIGLVIPELHGRLDGLSMRVPTANVSLVDLSCELERATSAEEVNAVLRTAAEGPLAGHMGYTEVPLVSVDYTSNACGGVVDGLLTHVMDKTHLKLVVWYDNESGYSNQLVRLLRKMAASL
ncbi:type I glyceraldehyde-3-phosphate dehydrogenase [Desulfocurvus vexinensis]|uniref:type I glyceraldehyde-3-phosphate dehydrogenase n=1 Tax=Desulfocurvus vexinensis TaxID=399548 RepID=UPI00048EAF6F|nr:type I glyceraldehyde-3-phosphate dehydrogenase [Desulfocurvus vexinensis]